MDQLSVEQGTDGDLIEPVVVNTEAEVAKTLAQVEVVSAAGGSH